MFHFSRARKIVAQGQRTLPWGYSMALPVLVMLRAPCRTPLTDRRESASSCTPLALPLTATISRQL
jgi:hypothetical protein